MTVVQSANRSVEGGQPPRRFLGLALYPNISTRIIAPFLLVIIIVAGIGVFIVTHLVASSIQERFTNQLTDSANAASNSMVDIERQQLAALRLMTLSDGVPEAIAARNTADLDSWLRPLAANAKVDSLIVYDKTGQGILILNRVIGDTNLRYDTSALPNLSNWGGVQRVLGTQRDTLGDKFIDLVGVPPATILYISAPVMNSAGELTGGISIGIQMATMAQRIGEQALSSVAFFTNDGQLLTHNFRIAQKTPFPVLSGFPDTVKNIDSSPIREISIDGTAYQVLFTRWKVRSQPVGILGVALPNNFIVQQSSASRDIFGLLFSGLFVVVGILGVLTARTITNPVARLVKTTRAIRKGDLSRRVKLHLPDELGELANSFDHMTDALVKRNDQVNTLYLQQIRETAQRDAILSSISDAVIVQDIAGKVILHNTSADNLTRMVAPNRALQREFVQLCSQPANLLQPKTVALANQYFSVLAAPFYDPDEKLIGYVLVFRDVTPIFEAERLKDELILQMSHELRTPLTAARGYVDLIKVLDQGNLSEQSRGFLEESTHSLDTLERLINQVIDVGVLISDRFTIDIEQFDLIHLLDEIASAWTPAVQDRQLALSMGSSATELWVEGSRKRIGQVIEHLLRNAYSYTLPGGSVEIQAYRDHGDVVVSVSDSGVGIGEDELDKVFERLYRGRSADAGPTDARGMGLGLFLSRRIMEAHHRTIDLVSEVGLGTTVTFSLPMAH
ncbi:MAG: ATP-binding protein [Chloroflexota bacterium]